MMLVHEFVVLEREETQKEGLSYDILKGKKYIKVNDDIILNNHEDFLHSFKTHWHYIGREKEGLAYHGITIILNEDLEQFMQVLEKHKKDSDIKNLIALCQEALTQKKDIVHFGI